MAPTLTRVLVTLQAGNPKTIVEALMCTLLILPQVEPVITLLEDGLVTVHKEGGPKETLEKLCNGENIFKRWPKVFSLKDYDRIEMI